MKLLGNLFACGICPESFSSSTDLVYHVHNDHVLAKTSKQEYEEEEYTQKHKSKLENETSCKVQENEYIEEKTENKPKDLHIIDAWKSNHTVMNNK